MAYDYFAAQSDDEDKDKDPSQQLSSDSSVVTGTGNPVSSTAGSGDTPKGTSSGQFTNLQSYLDANKGTGFGAKAAGDAQKTVDSANSAINTVDTGFRTKVDQGSVNEDSDLLGKVKSNPVNVDADAFTKQRDAKYSGPNTLSDTDADYMKAYSAQDQAKQLGEQTKTEGGRKAWLGQQYGANAGRYDYTSGMQNLDNLILQNDPNAQTAFQGVQQNAADTGNRFSGLQSQLDAYAQQRSADTTKTRADARSAVGIDDSGNWLSDSDYRKSIAGLDIKAADLNGQRGQQIDLQQRLSQGTATPEELSNLGLDPNQRGYGVDLGQYYSPGGVASRADAADSDTQAKLAALAKLAGNQDTSGLQGAQVGGYKGAGYDATGYGTARTAGEKAYQDQLATLKSQIDSTIHPTQPLSSQDDWKNLITNYKALLGQEQSLVDANAKTIGGGKGAADAIYQPIDPNAGQIAGGPFVGGAPVNPNPFVGGGGIAPPGYTPGTSYGGGPITNNPVVQPDPKKNPPLAFA